MASKEEVGLLQRTTRVRLTERETDYLTEKRLGRLATVSPSFQPHVVPVTYEYDGGYLYFSGWNLKKSLKFRNIQWNNRVALVVDDLISADPWLPRGIEIRGVAEVMGEDGRDYVRVTPLRKTSWGL